MFTERVVVPRPRLFSHLWCLCVWIFVLRSVIGRLVFGESTSITHLLNDWALLMHLSSPFSPRQHSNRGSSACLQEDICCSVRVRSHGFSAADCSREIDHRGRAQQIGDVVGIFSWLGSDEPWCTALIRVLGGGQRRLRDLVYVPADLWQATVSGTRIPQGETQRDLTAPEVEHVAIGVSRVCGPHCARRGGCCCRWTGLWCPQDVSAGSGHHCRASGQALLLDAVLDSELARLPQAKVRVFTSYVKLPGAEPSEDIEPALEQVGAIHQVITAVLVPFADVGLLRKLTDLTWTFMPDGTWQLKELPGPPSFFSFRGPLSGSTALRSCC